MQDSSNILGSGLRKPPPSDRGEYSGSAGDNRRRPDGSYRSLSNGETAADMRRAGIRDEDPPSTTGGSIRVAD